MSKERKSYRLRGWNYRTPWWYFVTICTHEHNVYFGDVVKGEMELNKIGEIAKTEWQKISVLRENVELDEFIIMPNHLHGIIIINEMSNANVTNCRDVASYVPTVSSKINDEKTENYFSDISPKSGSLSAIIRSFKSSVTKTLHEKAIEFKWQSRFYDRIIRNQRELDNIRRYIQQNPLRWDIDNDVDNIEL